MVRLTKRDKAEIRDGMQHWVGEHFDYYSVGNACDDTVSALLGGTKAALGRKYCKEMFWKRINKCLRS